jgi:NAD(P)-dependent dehydrogenase (short-subunit alcohol dehydrogenase family)
VAAHGSSASDVPFAVRMTDGLAHFDFSGRVAFVTGAGRGIGLATARAFALGGARVVMIGRSGEALDDAARTLGSNATTISADVGNPGDVERAVSEALRTHGRIDVLVNNAGVGLVAPTESVDRADWQRVLDTNLTGAFQFSQLVGREMLRAGGGSIVNVGSLTAFLGFPMRAAYAASKAGLAELTRVLASEWGPRGIRVNCVIPGWIDTIPVRRLVEQGTLDEERIVTRTPLRRMGTPEDVAGAVLFLASDAARFVTGVTLAVDGGWLAYGYL